MWALALALAGAGLGLFFGGRWIAQRAAAKADPVALARVLQTAGAVLLLLALLAAPR